ncbi:HI1506-related protein [Vogesella sp. AC12]|uniref:HI1506-related protein n=1 Tax=Vogesella sp. AC12 TaxID=2950550 RepID=UPI002109A8FA|nr:HI1506-related protein [Vogesella sp. AC12]MCQ4142836.1 HI1506-related protein [Vogesella sp. AC12]
MKLQVKSLREGGFCRLGVKWPTEGKVVDHAEFTDEQWERLMKEPNLKVEQAPEEPVAENAGSDTVPPATSTEETSDSAQGETDDKAATTTPTTKGNGGRKAAGAGA